MSRLVVGRIFWGCFGEGFCFGIVLVFWEEVVVGFVKVWCFWF